MSIAHFTEELFAFLAELTLNNNRPWWEVNKARYEEVVRGPALAFITEMGPRIRDISPHFEAIARKSGGSMMRPFRDIRFSKDKTPFKTNVGIQFRHSAGKDVHAPGFYLHLDPSEAFVGVGMWHPDKDGLAAIRGRIDTDREGWKAARDAPGFAAVYRLGGESLKRAPKGYATDHPLIEDLRRKDFIAAADLSVDQVCGDDFADELASLFELAVPFQRFLADAIGQRF